MTTLVGTQSNLLDAIKELIELDFDAAAAYKVACDDLKNTQYKMQLQAFMADHERHISQLSQALHQLGEEAPEGPGLKRFLTKGKVQLANIAGDKAILRAMSSNEDDTVKAYERMSEHPEMRSEFRPLIQEGLADERRHKAWLEQAIETDKS